MAIQGSVGQVIGNWRILRPLGEGAFASVFEAEHTTISGRSAAIKILRPELSLQPILKQRFLNEASAASRAEHENIVQIFDGGITADGTCYQVMELLRGVTLSELLKREQRLEPARALNIAAQIAAALGAAHALQIVHREQYLLKSPSRKCI